MVKPVMYLLIAFSIMLLAGLPSIVVMGIYRTPTDDQLCEIYLVTVLMRVLLSLLIFTYYIRKQALGVCLSTFRVAAVVGLTIMTTMFIVEQYSISKVTLFILSMHMTIVPVYEELLFRHAVLVELGNLKLINLASISSLLFGLGHFVNIIAFNSSILVELGLVLTATAIGVLLLIARLAFRSVVFSIVLHWAFNVMSISSQPLLTGEVPHRNLVVEDASIVMYLPYVAALIVSVCAFGLAFRRSLHLSVRHLLPDLKI